MTTKGNYQRSTPPPITTPTSTATTTSRSISYSGSPTKIAPSSVLANHSENVPDKECCCFSARFVNLVLFLFNFIFLLSGICIILLTVLYGRPEVSRYLGETTKYLNNIIALLGNGHLVQIIHYSMLFCGIVIIVISLLNIIFSTATSWSKSSDYYYYKRRRQQQYLITTAPSHQQQISTDLNEDESLLHYGSNILDSSYDQRPRSTAYLNDSSTLNRSRQSHYIEQTSKQSSSSLSSSNNNNNGHWHNGRNGTTDPPKRQMYVHHHEGSRSRWSHYANSTVVLCFYIFILLFLFTIQLVIGLLSVLTVSPDHVFISTHNAANDDFLVSVRESVDIPNLLVNRAEEIEPLYGAFHCCGWIYYDDYEYLTNPNERNKSVAVPDSCCKTYMPNCGQRKHPNNIYYDGCWSKFGSEMRDYVLMLGWTALGFAVIELIGLMFAACHYVQIISRN